MKIRENTSTFLTYKELMRRREIYLAADSSDRVATSFSAPRRRLRRRRPQRYLYARVSLAIPRVYGFPQG